MLPNLKNDSRKSQRLSSKRKIDICDKNLCEKKLNTVLMNEKKDVGNLGYFDMIPLEITIKILQHIPVFELGIMTMCSKNLRDLVHFYITSIAGTKHLLLELKPDFNEKTFFNYKKNMESFELLGLLLKRLTFLYTTKHRIQVILEVMKKASMTSPFPFKSRYLKCFGRLAHIIMSGWERPECKYASDALICNSGLEKIIFHVFSSSPGSYPEQEKTVRIFFRFIYLDLCQNKERGFWLTTILKPYPYVHQARLLFILFGPYNGRKIGWFSDETTMLASYELRNIFCDLSLAFQILLKEKDWSSSDILALIKELTNEWNWNITSCFLHSCGPEISFLVMKQLLVNGRLFELTSLITNYITMCDKLDCDMKEIVHIIEELCKTGKNNRDVVSFIKMLPVELLNRTGEGEDMLYDFEGAQKKFLNLILIKAFNINDNFHYLHEE